MPHALYHELYDILGIFAKDIGAQACFGPCLRKANEGFELTGGDRNIVSFVFDALRVPTNVANNRNVLLIILPVEGLLAEKGKTSAHRSFMK